MIIQQKHSVLPCFSHVSPMFLPWFFHRCSMVLPWVSHGASILFHLRVELEWNLSGLTVDLRRTYNRCRTKVRWGSEGGKKNSFPLYSRLCVGAYRLYKSKSVNLDHLVGWISSAWQVASYCMRRPLSVASTKAQNSSMVWGNTVAISWPMPS